MDTFTSLGDMIVIWKKENVNGIETSWNFGKSSRWASTEVAHGRLGLLRRSYDIKVKSHGGYLILFMIDSTQRVCGCI